MATYKLRALTCSLQRHNRECALQQSFSSLHPNLHKARTTICIQSGTSVPQHDSWMAAAMLERSSGTATKTNRKMVVCWICAQICQDSRTSKVDRAGVQPWLLGIRLLKCLSWQRVQLLRKYQTSQNKKAREHQVFPTSDSSDVNDPGRLL